MTAPPGPAVITAGTVCLSGHWLEVARRALGTTIAARRRNGLAATADQLALAEAITAAMLSDRGQSDTDADAGLEDLSIAPTVTTADAAQRLGLSERTIRRIAAKLGGRKIGGVWMLDHDAINEHRRGAA